RGTWSEGGVGDGVPGLVKCGVQRVDVAYLHEDGRPWRSISMMGRQVERHAAARDLQVHRPVAFTGPPVQRASEIVDIEADGRGDVLTSAGSGPRRSLGYFRKQQAGCCVPSGIACRGANRLALAADENVRDGAGQV